MRGRVQQSVDQPGFLATPSPFSIAGIFGRSAPDPLVMANHPSHLVAGGRIFPGIEHLGGVQTIDIADPVHSASFHKQHASSLLHPMHSDALWILLLVMAAVGIVGFGFKAGPLEAKVGRL